MRQRHMDRAALNDLELEYEIRGSGEPVVLIHPGHFAEWFAPLLDEPALITNFFCGNPGISAWGGAKIGR